MHTETITFEPFDAQHLEGALTLSREAGWPHRKEDWAFVASLSEGKVALEGDRVIGTAFMTPYGDDCATVNLVIVDPRMRGRGLGRRLTTAAIALAGDRECRLNASADGLPLYQKLGFVATGEIRQHQGITLPVDAPANVEWVGPEALPSLMALDCAAFGADRAALFSALATEAQFAALHQGSEIVAFAAVRPFGRGEVIGPVVAADADQVIALMNFILSSRAGQFVRIDIPGNPALSSRLEDAGLPCVNSVVAMVRGGHENPQPASVKTFALVTQAFG